METRCSHLLCLGTRERTTKDAKVKEKRMEKEMIRMKWHEVGKDKLYSTVAK